MIHACQLPLGDGLDSAGSGAGARANWRIAGCWIRGSGPWGTRATPARLLRGRPGRRANSRPAGGRRSPLGIRADRIATPFVLAGWTDAQAGIAPVLCWMLGNEGLATSSTRSGQSACEGVSGLRRSALAWCTFDTAFAGCRLTTSVLAQRTLVAAAPARHRSGGTDGH